MTVIASWNVNSIRAREEHLRKWLKHNKVDVLGLQETKVQDPIFPVDLISELGFEVFYSGQKSYNGVCTLYKEKANLIGNKIPDFQDDQKRIIAVKWRELLIVNAYVPNGSEVGSSKYEYKLSWLEAFYRWLEQLSAEFKKIVVLGDFNIAPSDEDVYDPSAWKDKILCSPKERSFIERLKNLNLVDTFRSFNQQKDSYSWWDYRGGSFRRNHGLRIDLIFVSSNLKDSIIGSYIDASTRKWHKPSDHAPVSIEIKL